MKRYVDIVFKKAKKPLDKEKIYEKVSGYLSKANPDFVELTEEDMYEIDKVISEGIDNYDYILTPNNRYVAIYKTSYRKGKFYGNRNGEGTVSCIMSYTNKDGEQIIHEEKYPITKDNCNNAIDGDYVLVEIGNSNQKVKVEKIINRQLENIAGEVIRIGECYFVKPIDKKKQILTIALEGEAIEGQRVAVSLKKQTSDNFYIGEITRVFNHKDDPGEDVLWEAYKCGIDDKFSKASLEQITTIPQSVREIDKVGREDLTSWQIFTIDGEDTKDIDDALSIRKLDNGNYEVGVHIADVSYYVKEGTPLDLDAHRKGTSNYLAGKVIPMLPHELSNGICSLNPYVERLALSCIVELTPDGRVINKRITPTVIKSKLKMTYTKVNDYLNNGVLDSEYEEFASSLLMLRKMSLVLRKNRLMQGAIEFDRPELKLLIDENGEVEDFSLRKQDVGENLIEEFMLLANETVDKTLTENGYPCLHRIHNIPNEDRLNDFLRMLEAIDLPFSRYSARECATIPYVLQELAGHIKDSGSLRDMLTLNMIRCMSRAKYSPVNIGHSGLAKDNYCHFTSPIRRYPDLTVHRIIKDCYLDPENSFVKGRQWNVKLPEIGEHSSKMEKTADEAELETLYMKCAEYMEKHIGEEYSGTIIGLSDKGIQIQLDNMVEGKVRISSLPGDYIYNSTTYTLLSLDDYEDYYIGDRLLLRLVAASKEDKTINFKVLKKEIENSIDYRNDSNCYVKNKAYEDRSKRALEK